MKGVPIQHTEYKRFLTEQESATYAGMSLTEFRRDCTVHPQARAQGRKVYDVVELDKWLDAAKTVPTNHKDIVNRLA